MLAFQCSSASRKFLNKVRGTQRPSEERGFSALQRAENSSIAVSTAARATRAAVSVLFSEPKIPQCCHPRLGAARVRVSVLFSEPKIPQSTDCGRIVV